MGKYKDIDIIQTHGIEDVELRKKCTSCNEIKLLEEFKNSKNGLGGKHSKCKSCMSEFMKKYNKTDQTKNKAFIKDGELVKECNVCNEIKKTNYFYRHGKGFTSQCKICMSNVRKKGTAPELITVEIVDGLESKKCRGCLVVKSLDEFNSTYKKGIKGKRARCQSCEKLKWKEYREKNRERNNASSKRWRLLNPLKQKESATNWRKNNKQKDKVYQNKRKVAEMNLRNDLTVDDWQGILNDFEGKCALSGVTNRVTMDHFIPISTGFGGTYVGNVYPLSHFLNTSKHNRNPFEWCETYGNEHGVENTIWLSLIQYLANQNGMTITDFEKYVNSCFHTADRKGGENLE